MYVHVFLRSYVLRVFFFCVIYVRVVWYETLWKYTSFFLLNSADLFLIFGQSFGIGIKIAQEYSLCERAILPVSARKKEKQARFTAEWSATGTSLFFFLIFLGDPTKHDPEMIQPCIADSSAGMPTELSWLLALDWDPRVRALPAPKERHLWANRCLLVVSPVRGVVLTRRRIWAAGRRVTHLLFLSCLHFQQYSDGFSLF